MNFLPLLLPLRLLTYSSSLQSLSDLRVSLAALYASPLVYPLSAFSHQASWCKISIAFAMDYLDFVELPAFCSEAERFADVLGIGK